MSNNNNNQKMLEVGAVVNTHGVRGGLKINCQCDSPDFLRQFTELNIGGKAYKVESFHVHKSSAIVQLQGIDTVQDAQALRSKLVTADVSDIALPDGRYFIADLIGLPIIENNMIIGKLVEILTLPAHDVYVLDNGRMIPNVPEFIKEISAEGIRVSLIEGL